MFTILLAWGLSAIVFYHPAGIIVLALGAAVIVYLARTHQPRPGKEDRP